MYPPDGLLTSGFPKHDVGHDPHIIAPDPFMSDGCLDVFSLVPPFPPPEPEELNTMNPSEDDPSSGLNGRLRPRRSTIPSPLSIKPIIRKLDGKPVQEKQKRSNTPSKASPSQSDDLSDKPILLPIPQLLCPYCDRKFGSKQNLSKHIRRIHFSTSKSDTSIVCLFCNHVEIEVTDIIQHMVDSHPNQYFACLDCHTRFPSTKQLAEHKLNICERQKIPYCSKLCRKTTKTRKKSFDSNGKDTTCVIDVGNNFNGHGFKGIVISCELKPSHIHDDADIEDNITTNLILPPNKNLSSSAVLEKNAVIVLDDIQWNRRIPSNFSFHNSDADQILSRLGVVHKSPRTGDSTKKGWIRAIEDATQKFEKCFDTSFYSKVASNVQENLTKFLDGSFNFNPDPDNSIKTRKAKNSVVINTAEGFPILLACEQYSRNSFDSYLPRSMAPKHKWKWDSLETEKPWNPDQIKKDTHANNCIITLVSSLDIWTQLCMRRKFEDKFNITPLGKKAEKQNVIGKQLKEILESREIPSANSQIVQHLNTPLPIPNEQDFPTSLGLMPSAEKNNLKPAILSGEWVRPRCYVCCACGDQSRDSRTLSLHASSHHPLAQVQHYEIVGESLLKADILQHLYVPPNQCVNRIRPTRGIKDCTKCNKSIVIEELHQHMLDCAGDTPAVRRKCRYRPFGVRRRRPRLPDNRIRKKMRSDIRTLPTRQNNRMRPKSKINDDVGDAETIRKMLADLPAKRHRVLVNPLNSILRPRRKLSKQRAMLMLKRRTSDDPKSGKLQKSNNTTHYDHSTNIDRYKGRSSRDDEDNKPLKSRLSRISSKIVRQKESIYRKPILKRPKRNFCSLGDEKETDDDPEEQNTITDPVNIENNELSMDQNDKRIDLNSDPENIREHSDRGDNNNGQRDNQEPGPSRQNDNNAPEEPPPPPCIPLKHSIARLTARSETHDKAVQFHQLFLIRQQANIANKHVPSGRKVYFENETVISRLDKPPLLYDKNIGIDPVPGHNEDLIKKPNSESILDHDLNQHLDSTQKNKLNKPRKGLNDCIAMLKNKLVDTDTNAPAHVSVQCGTDEPLHPEPLLSSPASVITPRTEVPMKTLQTSPCIERPKKSSPKSIVRNEQVLRPSPLYRSQNYTYDYLANINNERQINQWRPLNYEPVMPRFIDNLPRKETSRRRSSSQHENIYLAQQLLSMTPQDDMLLKYSSEPYDPYNYLPRTSPQNYPEQFVHVGNNILSRNGNQNVFDKSHAQASNGLPQTCGITVTNHIDKNRKSLDTSKKNTKTRVSVPKKPVEYLDKNINILKNMPKSTRDTCEKYRKKTIECRPHSDFITKNFEERKTESYPPLISPLPPRNRCSNINTDTHLLPFKPVERQLTKDDNLKMPLKVYSEHNFKTNQVVIPPAHASNKVQSIIPVPLDLSGKALPVHPQYSSRRGSVSCSYNRYETLDLSNKPRTTIEHQIVDEVVDLRVKHTPQNRTLDTLNPTGVVSQQNLNSVPTLNLIHQDEILPTDLSFKRKDEDKCINLSQKKSRDETQIQDVPKHNFKTIPSENCLNLDEVSPTDLSNRRIKNIEVITSISKESNKDNKSENLSSCDVLNEARRSNGFSEKLNNLKHNNVVIHNLTAENHVIVENNPKSDENINMDGNIQETIQTESSLNFSSHTQKIIYDPNLSIPQYKIKRSDRACKSKENNATVIASLTPEQNNTTLTACLTSTESKTIVTAASAFTASNATVSSSLASTEIHTTLTASLASTKCNTIVTASLASKERNHAVTASASKERNITATPSLASTESNTTTTASLASKERNTTATASLPSTEKNTTATASLPSTESNTTAMASLASKERNTTITTYLAFTENNTTATASLTPKERNTTGTASLTSKERNTTITNSLASTQCNTKETSSLASNERKTTISASLASKERNTTGTASLTSKERNTTAMASLACTESNTTTTASLASKERNTTITNSLASTQCNTKETSFLASNERKTTISASLASKKRNTTGTASLTSKERNTTGTASLTSKERNTTAMASLACTESNTTTTASLASKERNTTITNSLASTQCNTKETASLASKERKTTISASLASKERNTTATASSAFTESSATVSVSLASIERNTTVTASLASPESNITARASLALKEKNTTATVSLASKQRNTTVMASLASTENKMPVTTSLASKENDTTVIVSSGSKDTSGTISFASNKNNTTVTSASKECNTIVTISSAPKENNTTVTASYAAMSTGAGSYSSLPVSFLSQNSTLTTNSVIASIAAQERITCSFSKCILNDAVTSASVLMQAQPLYSLLNSGIVTTFTTSESTRPVYALPKTCISMARINTTTNSLLSIPSTTLLCTAPVYTLAGTTMVTPVNYATLPSSGHSIPYPSRSAEYIISDVDNQIMINYTTSNSVAQDVRMNEESILINKAIFNFDRDADILKTIIMFPLDILEVLKTMTAEHRKLLIDIVSKYLSVSKPTPILSAQLTMFSSSVPNSLAMPTKDTKELAVQHSTNTDKKPLNSSRVLKIKRRLSYRKKLKRTSFKLSSAALNALKLGFRNKVIDKVVSKDETNQKTNDVPQLILTEKNCTADPTANNVSKTNGPTANNGKTASLRAVRIKAPAERQKLKIADQLQTASCEQVQVLPNSHNNDSKFNIILGSNTFPNIQMYEVSSTQSNRNTVSDSTLSNHDIQPCKTMGLSVSDNMIKSRDDLAVKEHSEELDNSHLQNSLLRNQSPEDIGKVKEVIELNDRVVDPSLNQGKKSANNDQGKSLETYKLSAVENEDDSDDDISLAVIVQQKQQKQYNLKSLPKSNNNVICESKSKIKKDNKFTSTRCNQKNKNTDKRKSRKLSTATNTKINTIHKRDVENTVKDTCTANLNMTPLNNEDAKLTLKGGIQEKSKQVKNKEKINLSGTSLVNVDNLRDKIDIERQRSENESNKNNDKKVSDFCGEKHNLDLNGKEQNTTSFHIPIVSSNSGVKVYEGVESKTILNTNLKYITNIQENLKSNENNTNINIENRKRVEENQNRGIGTQNIAILIEACNQDPFLQSTVPQQCEELNDSDLKSCYSADKVVAVGPYETKLIRNNVPISNTLMAENPEKNKNEWNTFNREETETSLRRSGRGKSLFFGGNEQGVLMPSDGVLQPKAPLTKKQLIFSKLLLDEENNTKKLACIAVNPPKLVEHNVCQVVNSVNVPLEEKSILLKRKKSPVPKTKSKKKKSVDFAQPMNSEVHKKLAADSILAEYSITDIECIKPNPNLNREIDQSKDCAIQPQNKFNQNDSSEMPSKSIKVDENKEIELGGTIKRKIPLLSNNLDSVHMSEPKKSKLNNITDIGVTSNSVRQAAVDISNLNFTNTTLPLAARRCRSKSVVVQSSGPMLYDPYDIDLEDMGDITEPFRKQNKFWMCTTKENVRKPTPENVLHANSTESIAAEKSKETISDSDESSKSDVPLMKYVEEKERKKLLLSENINTKGKDKVKINSNDIKRSKKKHTKNKRTLTSINNVQKEDKGAKKICEEQHRSEQFMESFGFFSERKPRKSNLLASKKISETFHIIANESDDYWDTKGRTPKKSTRSENKKTVEVNNEVTYVKPDDFSTVTIKWDKKLKLRAGTRYCHVCKKEFRRVDNLVRHQMSLQHVVKLTASDSEPATPIPEEPNYLVIYKQHLDRLNMLEYEMKKKNPKEKFTFPSLKEILAEVEKTVRDQQLARTNLSRDQALFLDCCELLKDSNRGQIGNRSTSNTSQTCCASSYALANVSPKEYNPNSGLSIHFRRYNKPIPNLSKRPIIHTSARLSGMEDFVLPKTCKKAKANRYAKPSTSSEGLSHSNFIKEDKLPIIIGEVADEKYDSKSDGDVDSITALNILESEEVKNLENDLISGLKEAACKFQPLLSGAKIRNDNNDDKSDNLADISCAQDSTCPQIRNEESRKKETASKVKNTPESKEKKNLDICENIDIFEDKFDKIKRKCRSQAAAAKLAQTPVEPKVSYKSRKKTEKKKVKRKPKKCNPNTVPTKGALKGYDNIKVTNSTTDINMSAITPATNSSKKKKKKTSSKKKRDKKKSVLPRKIESHASKAESFSKHIDVYEFSDNEEPEVFELRPSTVMERFKKLNNKDTQFSNRVETKKVESSDSASDGDDFVYMSDDYVCSDDETENSLMSCELGNVKGSNEVKKSFSPLKRKDVMEKNAVMGKIFKQHAVRSEKKSKPKETTKPQANLDQLFDSLLEENPKVSVPMNNSESPKFSPTCALQKKRVFSPIVLSKYDSKTSENNDFSTKILRSPSPPLSSYGEESNKIQSKYETASQYSYQPSTSKNHEERKDHELPLKKNYDKISDKKKEQSPEKKLIDDSIPSPSDTFSFDTSVKTTKDSLSGENEKTLGFGTAYDFKDYYDDNALSDDAGVARQRARRKCTVGKQNILAETWSSESEPDGVPPRPNSAESVVLGAARKRKAKKRESHITGSKKGNKNVLLKKQDIESRVTSSNRNTGMSRGSAGTSLSSGSTSAYSSKFSLPGPSSIGPRLRPTTSYWADDDEEPEHVQQHGWIVGDSHKKLVTMLAHAKGRKRNNDDKRHFLE